MRLIEHMAFVLLFLLMTFFPVYGASEDEKRMAEEELNWIEKREEKVQQFVGEKKRDCVAPLMQPAVAGHVTIYCGKDAEEYRRNHPLEMKFQKWLDGLF